MASFVRNETAEQFFDRCNPYNLTNFNCSVDEYLSLVMGPKRLPLDEIVPISIVLVIIFLTGLVGNVSVCVVIMKNPTMRTATNYYLFSLAVSDLLLLLFGLPNDITVYWHQYPYSLGLGFCKLRALISEAASYVSVLTIVAFSLERYLAICHPLHLYSMAGLHRAVKIIAALWVVSVLAALPFAVHTTISYHFYPPDSNNQSMESAFCAMLEQPIYLCELSSVLFFLLPGVSMLFLYIRMGLQISNNTLPTGRLAHCDDISCICCCQYKSFISRRSRDERQGNSAALNGVNSSIHGEGRQAKSRKAIIRMLAAVVVAFFVCWAPFHFQRLFYIYGSGTAHYNEINQQLFHVTGALYYVSATVNPILYNVMSNRYRVAFRETLCCGQTPRGGRRFYREHSSVRESTVNQYLEGTHLVRIRSMARDRRTKLDTRYSLSLRSADSRSSRAKSWDTNEFRHINREIQEIHHNNVARNQNRKSENLVVDFKINSINDLENVNNEHRLNTNANKLNREIIKSKISLNISAPVNGSNTKDNRINETMRDFKVRDPLYSQVGELVNGEIDTRQDLLIVLNDCSKNIDASQNVKINCYRTISGDMKEVHKSETHI